jgi:Kef-type K+ transport system membrane component KefB
VTRWVVLGLVCVAAWFAGEALARFRVPRLPVYLAVGAVAAVLWHDVSAAADLAFPHASAVTLCVIGFVAGSHLVWSLVRPRVKPIAAQVVAMTVAVPLVVGVAVLLLVDGDIPTRLAWAVLAGTVMLALSPPEAIAIVSESRAAGPFTRLVLGSTVVMDVVVVSTFSVSLVVAEELLGERTSDSSLLATIGLMLLFAVIGGLLVGALLRLAVERGRSTLMVVLLVLLCGVVAAVLAPGFTELVHDEWGVEIDLDALLIAMIAGIVVVNSSSHGARFEEVLEKLAPVVYVVFFTLTGLGLHLAELVAALLPALLLWVLRIAGLWVGSTAAMRIVREPPVVRRVAWRAYVPQAGIALALAATVADTIPSGSAFSTVIVATVVLNEATGPLFLRSALAATGELPSEPVPEELD